MVIVMAALLALAFGLAASFLMSRASNFSAVTNLAFGAVFVLALAVVIFVIITIVERLTFG